MSSIKNNLKMSLSLTGLTVFVVVLAHWSGFLPDDSEARLNGRIELSEAIAVQISSLAKTRDIELMSQTLEPVVNRNKQITSMVLRKIESNDVVEKSTQDFIQIPIFKDDKKWALLEIEFIPLKKRILGGWADTNLLKLIVFVAVFSFIIYFFLVTKVLRYLDPYRAIPTRVKIAMDALTEGVVLVDENEQIVLVNQSFEKITGLDVNQLMGERLSSFDFSFPKRTDNTNKVLPWCESMKDGKTYTNISLSLEIKNSNCAFVIGSTPLIDYKGSVRGVLISFNDVTAVENMNQELKQMSNFLRHELRNALLGASSTINLLQSSSKLGDADQKLLTRASRSHRVIKYLLDKITEAKNIESSFEGDNNRVLDINSLLSEAVESYSTIYKDNKLSFNSDGNELDVFAEEERITQMLDKLVSNAVEHGAENTPVMLSCKKEDSMVRIAVTNEGPALPQNTSAIFDLFASFGGSVAANSNQGIGLYVVKLIAEAYGGSVEAKNRSDHSGVEFVIKIPLFEQAG